MPYLFSTCPRVNHHFIGLGCLAPLFAHYSNHSPARSFPGFPICISTTPNLLGYKVISIISPQIQTMPQKISPKMVNWTSKEHQNYICWLQDTLKTTISRDAVQICSVPQGAPQPQPAAFAPFLAQRLRFNVKSFEHRWELLEASHGVGFPTPGPRKTIRSDGVSLFEKITILEVPWIFSDTFAGDFEDGLNHPKLAETPNSMSSEGSHTEIWCKTSNLCRTLYTMSLCFLIIGWSLKCHPFLKHHLNCLGLGQIWVPKRCFFHKKMNQNYIDPFPFVFAGFLKYGYPNHWFSQCFLFYQFWMILGYPKFRKPPVITLPKCCPSQPHRFAHSVAIRASIKPLESEVAKRGTKKNKIPQGVCLFNAGLNHEFGDTTGVSWDASIYIYTYILTYTNYVGFGLKNAGCIGMHWRSIFRNGAYNFIAV